MSTPRRNEPDAEHRRAVHKLLEAVFAFAWRALGRHGLSAADRDDIAQNVAIAALRRWPTYRERSGTPGQWLWGIVRNELRVFLRAQGRQPVPAGDDLLDVASDAPTPEEGATLHDLADHLLSTLPVEQRRVVLLHEVVGLTYREIAALEGISKSEAHDRHRTGMRALAAAADRDDTRRAQGGPLRGVALVPIALADLAGSAGDAGPVPPGEAREGAWQRAAEDLGAAEPGSPWDAAPQSAPFTTATVGPLPSLSPPAHGLRSAAAWSWLRRLAPTGVALLGGLVAGSALQRSGRTPYADPQAVPRSGLERSRLILDPREAPTLLEGRLPAAAAPSRDFADPAATHASGASAGAAFGTPARPLERPAPAPPRSPARLPPARAPDDHAEALAEQALIDRGRAGLASGKIEQAIAAFAEHARRFPHGAFADERDRLLALACGQRSTAGTAATPVEGCAQARP